MAFSAKIWFRSQIAPYLTVISDAIGGGTGGYPPLVYEQDVVQFFTGEITTITLTGDFFTPDITVTSAIPALVISNVTFVNVHEITFQVDTLVAQLFTVLITTPAGSDAIMLESQVNLWIDLRVGSTTPYAVQSRSGNVISNDTEGLSSSGSSWRSWYKFPSHQWNRADLKEISIVMKVVGRHAVGIFGDEQNENANNQTRQFETSLFMDGGEELRRFQGTDVSHSFFTANIMNNQLDDNTQPYYRLMMENNGQAGANYFIYILPDLTDLDDNSSLVESGILDANFTADSAVLMIGASTNSPSRMVAFRVKDM